jgi:hypothetical protein
MLEREEEGEEVRREQAQLRNDPEELVEPGESVRLGKGV